MNRREFKSCIHPKELPRFLLACLIAVPLAVLLIVASVLTYGGVAAFVLLIVFFIWVAFGVFYAFLIGNTVRVSELNYPRVHRILEETKESIGVKRRVDVFVFDNSNFFAAFTYLFARKAVFIAAAILEDDVNDRELRWILGRFIGRVRAKRRLGVFNWIIEVTERIAIFNLFLLPYERATAYSGDRIALADIGGDISTAVAAMNKLYVGSKIGYALNPSGIVEQRRMISGSVFSLLARLLAPLPHLTDRYVDLIGFSRRRFPDEYVRFLAENPSFPPAHGGKT